MEYLVVSFPEERRVKINNRLMGQTNRTLELEGGRYTVTLDSPENFTPEEHQVHLRGTSLLNPATIEFCKA